MGYEPMVNGRKVQPSNGNIRKWKTKMAWLAGIIDGEGSILVCGTPKSGRHTCRIILVNTDEGILSAAKQILSDLEIFFTSHLKPASKNGTKDCWTVEVNRQLEVRELGNLLLPYLQSQAKKDKLSFGLKLISERTRTANGNRPNLRRQFGRKKLALKEVS